MTASVWVALAALALTSLVQIIGVVIWLTRLDMRMKTAETALSDLKGLDGRLVRIESSLEGIDRLEKKFNEFSESVKWMQSPASYAPGAAK